MNIMNTVGKNVIHHAMRLRASHTVRASSESAASSWLLLPKIPQNTCHKGIGFPATTTGGTSSTIAGRASVISVAAMAWGRVVQRRASIST